MIYMDVYMNSYFPHNLDTENSIIDLSKWQELADLIVDIFGADCGAIIKFTGHSFTTMLSSRNEASFLHKGTEWSSDSKSFCRTIIKTGKPLYIANAVEDEYWFDAPPVVNGPVRSYCGVPIFSPDGSIYGTICAIDTKSTRYEDALTKLLLHLSKLITSDLKIAEKAEQHRLMALTDQTTGLLNRRGLNVLSEQKFKDAKRNQDHIGVLYLDIDNLKIINDNFGHLSGDKCIKLLATILKKMVRQSDLIARIGGDEFTVLALISSENTKELDHLSMRIREVYQNEIKDNAELNMSNISIGQHLVSYDSNTSLKEMLAKADSLMYQEKIDKS
ncbi:diguanylate cyclase [Aliivibrio fischeri]|uniref:diguanylate cyclase n=2 Tax=Aliivibrio fischeri TaxID=668 RepID=A0A6N3Z6K2_ALIFS|nr:diguanylate cyclase [Aliivibrio fischeri]MUK81400.1 diguanylate cyclase [Aliivibrio fischeri]MUK84685.1 diguanylate cyclase [Aliivibrio fischeri]